MAPVPGKTAATILVCEDNDQLLRLVGIMLSVHGYRVLLAASAEQALELAAEHPDAIDVLVTDVDLPQMSGPELAVRLKANLPALEVLVLSGYPAYAIPGPPLPEGHAFLQKPFSDTSLLQTIHLLETTTRRARDQNVTELLRAPAARAAAKEGLPLRAGYAL
jgi:CheY-like chemotaxis protein